MSIPIRSYFLFLFLFGFLFTFHPVHAQAPVKAIGVDTSTYPDVNLIVSTKDPHFSLEKKNKSINFKVSEIFQNVEFKSSKIEVSEIRKTAKYLNLVLVVDNTLSINTQRFNEMIALTKKMLKELTPQDKVSLILAREEPKTIVDLTSNLDKILFELSQMKHNGKATRLYDGLYSALYTSQSIVQNISSDLLGESKTVVLLLTDGKEEASYITDNDCYELSNIGARNNIPVHMFIFNGNSKSSKVAGFSYRTLKRLSLKTGGGLIISPNLKDAPNLLHEIRSLAEPTFKVKYKSNHNLHIWPWMKVIVRVSLSDTDYGSIITFRVPFLYYVSNNNSLIWIFFALFCFIVFICWAILKIFGGHRDRDEKLHTRETYSKKNSNDSLEEEIKVRSEKELLKINSSKEIPSTDRPRSGFDDDFLSDGVEDTQEYKNKDTKNSDSFLEGQKSFQEEPPAQYREGNMLLENERTLYMREHSYRMLQLALKNAGSYRRAGLSTIIPSEYPSEPPKRRVYDLFLQNTLLGNGRWAHIPIRDNLASPVHARIKKIDKRFVIYDLMSGSGVYLNDNKVLRPMGLKNGDNIRIGRIQFTFLGKS